MIPDTIPFSSVVLGERGRKTYSGIEELADSIAQVGLIQPIVVEEDKNRLLLSDPPKPIYLLRAGGRRYAALVQLGTDTLYHAATSCPSRPGFLLANVASDVLRGLMIEIAENHDRQDIPWQDDLLLIVKAYNLFIQQEILSGTSASEASLGALRRQFGGLCKLPYADLKHGLALHKILVAEPDFFADCGHIRAAYGKMLRRNAEHVASLAAEKSFVRVPAFVAGAEPPPALGQSDPKVEPAVTIPLSKSLYFGDGLAFMRGLPDLSFDHIVTDPDYGVAKDALSAMSDLTDSGVHQVSIEASLLDLSAFLAEAFRLTKGFCVLWYDLDHHEKLSTMAASVGFCVQRWPLIWHKLDHRANGAPNHNFCKNIEYAMVLRKPSSTLAQAQTSCVYACPGGDTARRFGHPFAKPLELWRWIYSAVAIKGQTVLDPFAGKGTAPCAAIQFGLRPVACEINPAHFGDLTFNMQGHFREVLGTNINFS